MKKKKIIGAIMATALAIGSLAACSNTDKASTSGDDGNGKKITFWTPFSGADGPRMKNIVENYNKSQSEYEVNMQIVPQSDYYKTVDVAFSGQKNAPDLLIMHTDQLTNYVEKNLVKDVSETVASAGIKPEGYSETAWGAGTVDGKQYAIPLDIHPLLLYYNKDLFKAAGLDPEKAPVNREEFLAFAKKLTDKSKGQYGYVVPTLWPNQFIYPTIFYQNGGGFLKDGKPNYNSPAGVEALTFLTDLIHKQKVSPANVQQDGEVNLFLQGKNAMQFNGPWMMEQWDKAGINYGVAEVPQLGTKQQAVYANGHNFVIPATVKNKEKLAAINDFLKFTADNTLEWAKSGQAPASKAIYEKNEEFKSMVQQPKVAASFEYAKFAPRIANWGQVSDPLWAEVNLALLGKKDPKQALDDANKKADQILNK
ncbi:ABC transporter substrate-binding protein [Peribacillus muralis]|uniref:ABC transporter substrate-binding protein n=1 Tax=Peribacillus muralis TaxID=264697 RepID=UPI001F4D904A|nr:ABC transporter substrate-binding protein [Peribacillus muralis]MCK1994740.1 ABC transporter substrate-binding protein [Peribacillus muralis]MCK2015433.1 ABC transporter substrate-binding protein [Peribacillus muralis]